MSVTHLGRVALLWALRHSWLPPMISNLLPADSRCGCVREIGHLRIAFEYRSQRLLQRAEPALEMAPVIHTLAENRLSDLFRACCPHRARILVEAQALLRKRQPAIGEQPTHFQLGI